MYVVQVLQYLLTFARRIVWFFFFLQIDVIFICVYFQLGAIVSASFLLTVVEKFPQVLLGDPRPVVDPIIKLPPSPTPQTSEHLPMGRPSLSVETVDEEHHLAVSQHFHETNWGWSTNRFSVIFFRCTLNATIVRQMCSVFTIVLCHYSIWRVQGIKGITPLSKSVKISSLKFCYIKTVDNLEIKHK